MSYGHVNASLTQGQINKIQAKPANQYGAKLILKKIQLSGGPNKLSLTSNLLKRFNKAMVSKTGVQLEFSPSAIKDMIKLRDIFPLLAAIPALIAAAAPAVLKAVALGDVVTAAKMALKKATGKWYEKKRGLRLPGTYLGKGLRLPGT